jgi:hypothetical protein
MKQTKDITACVVDTCGNYVSFADRLSKEYKHVYYVNQDWREAYPLPNKTAIGQGIEGLEVIRDFHTVIDETDFFVFPDVYYGETQEWLKSQGEITFGSGRYEDLELYRDFCKQQMKKNGLPVNEYDVVKGFSALKDYLKKTDDVWVKLNEWRGLIETFHHVNYDLSEDELLEIEYKLGPNKEDVTFVIEEPIDNALEQGYDGITMDGTQPELWISGCEIKDKAYAGQIKPYSELSPLITDFLTAFAKDFKKYQYRGFISLENRIQGKKSFMTDFTARVPCPPGELYLEIFKNLGEVIWCAANGEMVKPEAVKQFGVELLIESQFSTTRPMKIYYPDKIANQVKLKKYRIVDGVRSIIPQTGATNDIGAVVGIGDTLEAAIKSVRDAADQIEGCDITIRQDTLDGAAEALVEAQKL